jgi:thioredoxin 1
MSLATSTTDTDFQKDVLKSETPSVVDFWAPWCAPCRMQAPILDALSAEMSGRVQFLKINVDDNPRTPARYGIQGIPTLLLFRGEQLVETIVGLTPESALRKKIESAFGLIKPNPSH